MNDTQAIARAAAAPHLSADYFAYYAGRNAGFAATEHGDAVTCSFKDAALRASFVRGVRNAASEVRINLDPEWD